MVRPNIRAWLQDLVLSADEAMAKRYLECLVMLHRLFSVIDVTAVASHIDKLQLLDSMSGKSERGEVFSIPMAPLRDYDSSPAADSSASSIASRDECLVRHFVGWSAMNVKTRRQFVVVDDGIAGGAGDEAVSGGAHHIILSLAE